MKQTNYQVPTSKQSSNFNSSQSKPYDLSDRTLLFAKNCRNFVNQIPKTIANREYSSQLIRSAASPAANYIEANEALSKKDSLHRLRICRKEAKESRLWLNLIEINNFNHLQKERDALINESYELVNIFSAIIAKNQSPRP